MAEKLDKVDIFLEEESPEEELSLEMQMYNDMETAERYINIAEHMKQFEDQDKYYTRANNYIRRVRDYYRDVEKNKEAAAVYRKAIKTIARKKFTIRAEGKVALYEEACRVRDSAKSPSDFYNAQTIFERIHKYEEKHKINPKWVTPELFEKTEACADSEEQAHICRKKADARAKQLRRHSLFISIAIIAGIVALLVFSRTTRFRYILGKAENLIGDHESAWQAYKYIYDKGDESIYDEYIETRYLAGQDAEKSGETARAIGHYRIAAEADYKDSEDRLLALELDRLRNLEKYDSGLGKVIPYGNVNWRVLEVEPDRILLLKDSALKKDQVTGRLLSFDDEDDPSVTWENSELRHWLNDDNEEDDGLVGFIGEQFTPKEKGRILYTELEPSENPVYGTADTETTTDRLFLLTSQEVERYKLLRRIRKTKSSWWLRTPGKDPGTRAYVFPDKTVMNFGYVTDSIAIAVKPCMWVDISE